MTIRSNFFFKRIAVYITNSTRHPYLDVKDTRISMDFVPGGWFLSGLFCLCVLVFIVICAFIFLYSTWTKLRGFNYFTITITPLCVVHLSTGSIKVVVVLSNLLLYRLLLLTEDGCTYRMFNAHIARTSRTVNWLWLSRSNVTSYVRM